MARKKTLQSPDALGGEGSTDTLKTIAERGGPASEKGGFWQLPLAMLTGGLAGAPLAKLNRQRQLNDYAKKGDVDVGKYAKTAGIDTTEEGKRGEGRTKEAVALMRQKAAEEQRQVYARARAMGIPEEMAQKLAAEAQQATAMEMVARGRLAEGQATNAREKGAQMTATERAELAARHGKAQNTITEEEERSGYAGEVAREKIRSEGAEAKAKRFADENKSTVAGVESKNLEGRTEKEMLLKDKDLEQRDYQARAAVAERKNLDMAKQMTELAQQMEQYKQMSSAARQPTIEKAADFDANLGVSPYTERFKALQAAGVPKMIQTTAGSRTYIPSTEQEIDVPATPRPDPTIPGKTYSAPPPSTNIRPVPGFPMPGGTNTLQTIGPGAGGGAAMPAAGYDQTVQAAQGVSPGSTNIFADPAALNAELNRRLQAMQGGVMK